MKFFYLIVFCLFLISSFVNASECKKVGIMDIKNLKIIDTKMKNPNGLLSFKSEFAIYIKTKNCKKWRIIPETTTNNLWDINNDIIEKFQIAVRDVALIEQSIRNKFNLGKRKRLLMEKAQDWEKAIDKYCATSFLGCQSPDVDCLTILGKTYCIWGDDYVTSSG